jgi:UDP-N-acetylmuramate dehydrogenase
MTARPPGSTAPIRPWYADMQLTIHQARLENYTTFRLGGPCPVMIECETPEDLKDAVERLNAAKKPFVLIGGGSNLVVSDHGLDVAVVRYVSNTPLIERDGNDVVVAASTSLDDLALFCVDEALEGLNYTTGIPGTVGGAVVGNAGAWGKQVGDVLKTVTLIEPNGKIKEVGADYCGFQYRHSKLKETGDIVVSVRFGLKPGDPVALAQERADILKKRAEKHPNLSTHPCAGSFFRNVEPTSKADRRQAAGWFLEEAGGKNLSCGGAQIFEKHANIIVKGPNCKAQDVYDLSQKMIKIVREKFGFDLVREVRFVGRFDTPGANEQGFW